MPIGLILSKVETTFWGIYACFVFVLSNNTNKFFLWGYSFLGANANAKLESQRPFSKQNWKKNLLFRIPLKNVCGYPESSSLQQHFSLLWKAQALVLATMLITTEKAVSASFTNQYLSKPLQAFKGSRGRKTYWVLVFEPLHSPMIYCFFFTSTTQIKYLLCVQIVLGSQVWGTSV